jgi:hypothetical protein
MLVNCKTCDKSFNKKPYSIKKTKNNFCSRSCAASYNNRGVVRNKPKPRVCKKCLKTFVKSGKHRSLFCNDCYETPPQRASRFKSMTLDEFHSRPSVADKHPSWKNAHIRNQNRSWNKNLTKLPCQNCGYNLHVELAHIKPITSFAIDATIGEINNPDNLFVLCRNCHWEFDNGHLDDIPSRRLLKIPGLYNSIIY